LILIDHHRLSALTAANAGATREQAAGVVAYDRYFSSQWR
jgi:hypothetical protein